MVAKPSSGLGFQTVDEQQPLADVMRGQRGRCKVTRPRDASLIWLLLSMGNQALLKCDPGVT